MKNLNLLRLAGFGFFGAVFLSPVVPGQHEDWLLEKINVAKKMTSLPFTMSALYRENYPTEQKTVAPRSNPTAKPNFLLSVCLPEDVPEETIPLLFPFYELPTGNPNPGDVNANRTSPAENQALSTWEDIQSERIYNEKIAPVENMSARKIAQTEDKEKIEPLEETEYRQAPANANTTHIPEYIPGQKAFKEDLFPPTKYVDEVIVSKKPYRKNQLPSALVPIITMEPEAGLETYPSRQVHARIQELSDYARENSYSTEYALIINLGLKSGKKRCFLVDLRTGTIVNSGLVAHGRGKEKFTLNKHYSNVFGSACSSLGLYKIGSAYNGGFGKSFRLIGLQKTNNNALSRAIVLHAMSCIPNEEIDYPICQSEGCPSLSPEFLESVSPVIKKSQKPMLLWIFDPAIQ